MKRNISNAALRYQEIKSVMSDAGQVPSESDQEFILSEADPELFAYFQNLQRLAHYQPSAGIKERHLHHVRVLKFACAELLELNAQLYDEIDALKRQCGKDRAVISEMANETGLDPNLISDKFRIDAIVKRQLLELKIKGIIQ